jgi:hypothetical protein
MLALFRHQLEVSDADFNYLDLRSLFVQILQMHQLKKRDFVATDHVSYCLKSSVNVLFVVFFICINLFVEQESCKYSFMLCENYFGDF